LKTGYCSVVQLALNCLLPHSQAFGITGVHHRPGHMLNRKIQIQYLCLFFLQYWGLNLGPSPWATPTVLFLWMVFWDRVS
jgi:hypothetical protein